ncbi:MAG: hypothetical protein BJ554DRAFT_5499, partial [Olpidium bornovanus]
DGNQHSRYIIPVRSKRPPPLCLAESPARFFSNRQAVPQRRPGTVMREARIVVRYETLAAGASARKPTRRAFVLTSADLRGETSARSGFAVPDSARTALCRPAYSPSARQLTREISRQGLRSRFCLPHRPALPPFTRRAATGAGSSTANPPAGAAAACSGAAQTTSEPRKDFDAHGANGGRDRLSRRDITIHVFDENRNSKRDFHCKKSALLREMKYFTSYIDEKNAGDYVDIDVHCDIEVFEWLMAHISRGKKEGPSLCETERRRPEHVVAGYANQGGTRTVISILISSSFLQMAKLTEDCLDYCHQHLSEVLTVPLDMSCISEKLLVRLAAKFNIVELNMVVDKRDKVLR